MSQPRFQIGVPRAGDAARDSEASSSEGGGWTRAKQVALSGSAARAAEERKRAEGTERKQGNNIALRATGGAVVDRETMIRHSATPDRAPKQETYSQENTVSTAEFPTVERISRSSVGSADRVPSPAANGEFKHESHNTQVQPGLLQSAAARLQTLTRSLFQRRERRS